MHPQDISSHFVGTDHEQHLTLPFPSLSLPLPPSLSSSPQPADFLRELLFTKQARADPLTFGARPFDVPCADPVPGGRAPAFAIFVARTTVPPNEAAAEKADCARAMMMAFCPRGPHDYAPTICIPPDAPAD